MIKISNIAQVLTLSDLLEEEAGSLGGIHISQANDGVIGLSRLDGSGKMEKHIYILTDGDTREIDYATR